MISLRISYKTDIFCIIFDFFSKFHAFIPGIFILSTSPYFQLPRDTLIHLYPDFMSSFYYSIFINNYLLFITISSSYCNRLFAKDLSKTRQSECKQEWNNGYQDPISGGVSFGSCDCHSWLSL